MSHSTEKPAPSPTRRPWRVAFCITELDPGGAERQLVRLATNLDRDQFEPEVICLSGRGELVAMLHEADIPVICLDARGRCDIGVVDRLRRHFRKSRPDVVQTFLFHANIAGRVAARLAGVPVVVSGIRVAERRHRWHLRLDRLTERLVDRHACVSRAVAEFSARIGGLPSAKLVVIPNAVDAERFAKAEPADLSDLGIPPGALVVLFIGRLDEQKNPGMLLEAFRLLAREQPDVRLLFVGTGPLEAALHQAASDLGGRVIFTGYRRDVPELLKAASCLALPSRWEGMPNVVLEAMAAGTPVVAAAAEGVSELLGESRYGSVVLDASAASLAEAIGQTLGKDDENRQKVCNAQSHVLKEFTTESMTTRYQRLYLELLEEAVRRPRGGLRRHPLKKPKSLQSQPG